jgi:hypothetical protein
MPTLNAIYAWSRDWQVLIAGLLTVLAACIFAIGAITAARIRSGVPAKVPDRDLRVRTGAANDDAELKLVAPEIASALYQLRWLIRSALSPQLFGNSSRETMNSCCERIFQLRLETATLPAGAPNATNVQKKVISLDINVLRELVESQAASSEIVSALIKLNASAREMASSLSDDDARPPGATTSSF